MVDGCRPQQDEVDKRILYEWTGMTPYGASAFEDDSSGDDLKDPSMIIDNIIGYKESQVHEQQRASQEL